MSKKDCLRLAHDLLDEELEKDSKTGTKFSSSRHTVKN